MLGRDRSVGSSRCSPSRDESCSHAATPRTLLPRGSSRGLCAASPICPGRTAEMAPLTPLLAGIPTRYSHSPA